MLCLDTCGPSLLLAVGDHADRLVLHHAEMPTGQAEAIIPALNDLLQDYTRRVGDTNVGSIAVTVGPGSFTGLRVGLAVAKARAVVDQALVVPVNRLQMMARCWALTASTPSGGIVSLDARRGERFMQGFSDQQCPVTPALAVPNEEESTWRADHEKRFGGGYYIDQHDQFAPKHLAQSLFLSGQQGKAIAHRDVKPLYVRSPDAKKPKRTRFRVA